MALHATKISHSLNSVKKLSSLNSKSIYLKSEGILSYQSVRPKYTFDIYKKAPFSPWHKTKRSFIQNDYCSLVYSYSTITYDKNIKREQFQLCNEGINFNANNQRLNARALSSKAKPNTGPSKLKQFGIAIAIGIAAGGGYAILKEWKKNNSIFSENLALKQIGNETADSTGASAKSQYSLKEKPPSFEPARQIRNPADTTSLKLTLFQYQTCPFCCKARAFLDYFGFNYDVIEVNSVMRTQMKWSSYKKVPTLVIETPENEVIQLVDSSMIISSLYSFVSNKSKNLLETASCYPRISSLDADGKAKEEISNKYFLMFEDVDTGRKKEDIAQERKWRKWVDDTFVHTLSPNVYRTPSESLQAFQWFNEVGEWDKHFSAWERFVVVYIGAAAMWIIGKRLKKRHGLKPDVRQSLYDETNIWLKAIKAKKSGKFMGGEKPNLADLAVYGALSAIEGCDAFKDLGEKTKVMPWFEAMKQAVKESEGKEIFIKS